MVLFGICLNHRWIYLFAFVLLANVCIAGSINAIPSVSPCPGSSIKYCYTPSSPTAGLTYNWTFTGASSYAIYNDTSVVTWNSVSSGTVRVKVYNGSTLIDSLVLAVIVSEQPQPQIVSSYVSGCERDRFVDPGDAIENDCFHACDSSVAVYSVGNYNAGSEYTWYVTGAISTVASGAGNHIMTVRWGSIGRGEIRVVEENEAGCIVEVEKCVTINETPRASFNSIPNASNDTIKACVGQKIVFNNTTQYSGSVLYSWYFGDGGTSYQMNPDHTYNDGGLHTIIMIAKSTCNCADTVLRLVYIDPSPALDIECVSTVCAGELATYFTTVQCSSYSWSAFGNNVSFSTATNTQNFTVQWGNGNSGPGIICLIADCEGFCNYENCVQVPIVAESANIHGPTVICPNNGNTIYDIPSTPSTTYAWKIIYDGVFRNDLAESDTNLYQLAIDWPNISSGTHTGMVIVKYYNTFLHCGGTDTLNITFKPSLAIYGGGDLCGGDTVEFGSYTGTSAIKWWMVNTATQIAVDSFTGLPYYAYFPPGNGRYKIIASDTSFCNVVEEDVSVIAPPAAYSGNISGDTIVCPKVPYQYSATPASSDLYIQWEFIGQAAGFPASPSGNTVTTVWDSAATTYAIIISQVSILTPHCASAMDTIWITKKPAPTAVIIGDTVACTNSYGAYTIQLSPAMQADGYAWQIDELDYASIVSGNGTPAINILWNNAPDNSVVTITVTPKVCGVETTPATIEVELGDPALPVIDDPGYICTGSAHAFTSSTTAASYNWQLAGGSGTSSAYTYAQAGSYPVVLTVTYSGGCTATASTTVNVITGPKVYLSAADATTCPPVDLFATVNSTAGSISTYTYQWRRNSTILSGVTAEHYQTSASGTYQVTVTDANTGCTASDAIVIDSICGGGSSCEIDEFDFSYAENCGVVSFSSSLDPGVQLVGWYFGDPGSGTNTSTLANPTHTYDNTAYYIVTMSVLQISGGDTCRSEITKAVLVPVDPAFDVVFGCSGGSTMYTTLVDRTRITDDAVVSITSYSWSINGGVVSLSYSGQSPSPIPSGTLPAGIYIFALAVTTNLGTTCTFTDTIAVPGPPNAGFSISAGPYCEGNIITFTANSNSADIIRYDWDFDDNSSSSIGSVTQRTFDIDPMDCGEPCYKMPELTVTDKYGCISVDDNNILIADNNLSEINSTVSPSNSLICSDDDVSISITVIDNSNNTISSGLSYLWSPYGQIASPILANQSGIYTVTVTQSTGCTVSPDEFAIVTVVQPPVPVIAGKRDYCDNDLIDLSCYAGSGYSYKWEVRYAPPASDTSTIRYTTTNSDLNLFLLDSNATNNGLYKVTAYIFNAASGGYPACTSSTTITIKVHRKPPNPTITASPASAVCANGETVLLSASAPWAIGYAWSTGDISSTIAAVSPGRYTVNAFDEYGCTADADRSLAPMPDFSQMISGCYDTCAGASKAITAPRGYSDYTWLVDDLTVADPTPNEYNYIVPGVAGSHSYKVVLTTNAGCKDTSSPVYLTFYNCDSNTCNIGKLNYAIVCNDTTGTDYTITISFQYNDTASATIIGDTCTVGSISAYSTATVVPGINEIDATFSGGIAGEGTCITLLLHNETSDTDCEVNFCVTVPGCGPPGFCSCPADVSAQKVIIRMR